MNREIPRLGRRGGLACDDKEIPRSLLRGESFMDPRSGRGR